MTLSMARVSSPIFPLLAVRAAGFATRIVVEVKISSTTRRWFVRRVVPEEERSTMASAIPRCGVASHAPPTVTIVTVIPRSAKNERVIDGNSVATLAPSRSSTASIPDSSGTATTRVALPISRSRTSSTAEPRSMTISLPVIPRSATPLATYSGISIGRAKRISTFGSWVRVTSLRSPPSMRRSPLLSSSSLTGPAILPLFGMARRMSPASRSLYDRLSIDSIRICKDQNVESSPLMTFSVMVVISSSHPSMIASTSDLMGLMVAPGFVRIWALATCGRSIGWPIWERMRM